MNYSTRHVQHLLSSLDRYESGFGSFATNARNKVSALRLTLRAGEHAHYREFAADNDICLCTLCHAPTFHVGTKLCDQCWETKKGVTASNVLELWSATPDGQQLLRETIAELQALLP